MLKLTFLCPPLHLLLPGPPRRHQQWDSQATSTGQRGPESLHERPSALPHTELGLPAPVLPPALPAHLPAVSGPLLARQRPVLPQLTARPAAAAAPGLAGPEAGSGERPAAPAPQPASPAVPGVPQGSAATVRPRHRYGTVGLYPYPWNTSLFRRRSGETAFTCLSVCGGFTQVKTFKQIKRATVHSLLILWAQLQILINIIRINNNKGGGVIFIFNHHHLHKQPAFFIIITHVDAIRLLKNFITIVV